MYNVSMNFWLMGSIIIFYSCKLINIHEFTDNRIQYINNFLHIFHNLEIHFVDLVNNNIHDDQQIYDETTVFTQLIFTISSMILLTLIVTFIYNICNKKSEQRPFWGHKLCEVAGVKVLPTFNNFILQIQMPIGEHSLNEYFLYNILK